MNDFILIADAGCDLSAEFQKQYDIKIIDGHLVLPDKGDVPSFMEWKDVKREDFYAELKKNPSDFATAPPNTVEYEKAFGLVVGIYKSADRRILERFADIQRLPPGALKAFGDEYLALCQTAQDYMDIVLPGMFLTTLTFNLSGLIRASGYASRSMWIQVSGALLNIALDALFIVVLGWGIRGGAWATTISMAFSAMLAVMHFMSPKSFIHFKRHCWQPKMYIIKNILAIGVSPFSMNVASCAVVALLNHQLLTYGGDLAVSAYGVVNRVSMIVFMIMMGICQGMQPIAGYNYGAGLNLRLKHVYTLSLKWNVGTGIVGMLFALIIPKMLVMMMNDDPQLISIAVPAMRYLLVMAPLIGFTVTNSQFFQSIDKPWIAIVTSLSRQFIFLIPMMFLVPLVYTSLGGNGLSGVWCSCTISDVLGATLSAILLYNQREVFVPGYIPPERKPRKERGPNGLIKPE